MSLSTPNRPVYEIILTTMNARGEPHHAPFGIHVGEEDLMIAPYRPSQSLDNLLTHREAVINFTQDVRIFAGCLTGRRTFPVCPVKKSSKVRLKAALGHAVIRVMDIEEDELRPRFHCSIIDRDSHSPFPGFNRAQAAVIEAAILMSRVHLLPRARIEHDMIYLATAVEKTAGPHEQEAWEWLKAHWAAHKAAGKTQSVSGHEPACSDKGARKAGRQKRSQEES